MRPGSTSITTVRRRQCSRLLVMAASIGASAMLAAADVPADLATIPTAPAAAVVPNAGAAVARAALSRAYGYSIGDHVEQRIALGSASAPFMLAELPRLGRIGNSLWRHHSTLQIDASGQRWLLLDYQLLNTPPALAVWYLPTLKLKAQPGTAMLTVASASFSMAPLTSPQPFALAGLPAVQPDHPVALVALAPIERRIRFATLALLLVCIGWSGLTTWHYLRRGRYLPFAIAVRALRAAGGNDALAARRLLHQALNASAGAVVRPASLALLLTRAPYLATERNALEQFLQQSQTMFFGGAKAGDTGAVDTLARRLRRLERRYAA